MAWSADTPRPVLPRGILEQTLTRIAESGPWGPLLSELFFIALVVAVAAMLWWLSGIAAIRVLARRLGAPVESLKPLGAGLHVVVLLGAAATLVSHFAAVDMVTLVAGAFTLTAVGFVALWSTLSNILCTLLILMTRPFRIGDELAFPPDAIEGRVVDLSFFFTTLRTRDGRFINVPNTMFFQRILVRREASVAVDLGEQLARKEVVDLESSPPRASAQPPPSP